MKTSIQRALTPLVPIAAATALWACAGPQGAATAHATASPSAVADHLRSADATRDYGAFLEVIAPDHRYGFVWGGWFGAAYHAIGADDPTVEAYRAINARFGLDEEWLNATSGEPIGRDGLERLAAEALADVDLEALLTELTAFTAEGAPFFGEPTADPSVTVEGDRAVARVGTSELVLRRQEDGRWYWLPGGDDDI